MKPPYWKLGLGHLHATHWGKQKPAQIFSSSIEGYPSTHCKRYLGISPLVRELKVAENFFGVPPNPEIQKHHPLPLEKRHQKRHPSTPYCTQCTNIMLAGQVLSTTKAKMGNEKRGSKIKNAVITGYPSLIDNNRVPPQHSNHT